MSEKKFETAAAAAARGSVESAMLVVVVDGVVAISPALGVVVVVMGTGVGETGMPIRQEVRGG